MSAVTQTRGALVACRGVSVIHGEGVGAVRALQEVDLTIEAGESVALLGRSGSGKTTLLHVIGGVITPTQGVVDLGGSSLSSLDAAARGRARAATVAYVFQGANLLPHFTAFENIAFAARASQPHGPRGNSELELLELVGLRAKADALPAELSGGEAQRVAIARALAQQPQLLLCDEPTGHLDLDTGERVLKLIDAAQEEFGFALITATHDPAVAARFSRSVELADGQIVQPTGTL